MTLRLHHLRFCSPTPFGLSRKAVGTWRLVPELADGAARKGWQDEYFSLLTKVNVRELDGVVGTVSLRDINGGRR
ncbi:MAG: hypothetical protein KDA99_07410 [Planctomycetales bacterium]|nr:hypothetical protein [Planctomycetales bacterium]